MSQHSKKSQHEIGGPPFFPLWDINEVMRVAAENARLAVRSCELDARSADLDRRQFELQNREMKLLASNLRVHEIPAPDYTGAEKTLKPEAAQHFTGYAFIPEGSELKVNTGTKNMKQQHAETMFTAATGGHRPSFNKLMPAEAERLALLLEELGEAQQIIGKILRHGYESHHPDGGPCNRKLLEMELGDVIASCHIAESNGDIDGTAVRLFAQAKLRKVGKYLHHNTI